MIIDIHGKPQKIKVQHYGDDKPSWITIGQYLDGYIESLVPMSVGQCFRFLMHNVLDIDPNPTVTEVLLQAEAYGRAMAYAQPGHPVVLVLPQSSLGGT